jgi:PAS domain S-box-containing protein
MPILGADFFQTIRDPLLLVQENSVIIDCNAGAEQFMGAEREQIVGHCLGDFSPGAPVGVAHAVALENIQQALATGYRRAEWLHHKADGSSATLDVMFSKLAGLDPPLVLVHWHDVSEHRRMEEDLRRSEERYRLLAEHAHDVIWVMGLDGRFSYISPSVQRLRGYTPEEALQQPVEEVLTPESLRVVQAGLEEIAAGVQAGIRLNCDLTEVEQLCKDGSTVWTEVKVTGVYNDAGRFIGILGVTRDISERRQRDEQLRQINATLEQRVRERTAELEEANVMLAKAAQHKDEFLATISHELRTPLTGILSFTQALEENVYGVLPARQLQAVRQIKQAGDQLLGLINSILDLSRLQVEALSLQRQPVTVDLLCRLSLRLLEHPDGAAPHQVAYYVDRPELTIDVDEQRIVQMLSYLLSNAVKFTPAGGRIELRVQSDLATRCVTFSVSDTGIGIAPGDLPRLFQPFVQLDARLARQYQGTGIGLALVRAIAELHGGTVGVESTRGVGSRFWVKLPLA